MRVDTKCFITFVVILALLAACAAPTPAPPSASELLDLGERYLLELNYEQAVAQFLAVIEIEPMNARAYIGAAEAYVGLGRDDEAVAILRQGLERLPEKAIIQTILDDLTDSSTDEPASTPTQPAAVASDSAAYSHFETIIATGSAVRADLSAFVGPTYVDGIKFAESITTPSGEVVLHARLIGIETFGAEWLEYSDNMPQLKESVYEREISFIGRLTFDETHTDGTVPHPNPTANLGTYVNDPWGPYIFTIASVEVSNELIEPEVTDVRVDIFPSMSKTEHKALHTFLSNFAEVGMREFDADNYTDDELIEYAIWHTYRNNWNLISYSPNREYNSSAISGDVIATAITRYFGISVKHMSAGYVDNSNYWNYGQYMYPYEDGNYYFSPADGDPLGWAQVTSLIDNNDGTYTAYFDKYATHAYIENLYEDIDDWNLNSEYGSIRVYKKGESSANADYFEAAIYINSFVTVVKPYDNNGRATYQLISLKPTT